PIYHATTILSTSSHPMQGDLSLIFKSLSAHLEFYGKEGTKTQIQIAAKIKQKFNEYWNDLNYTSMLPAILDPCSKLSTFDDEDERVAVINLLQETYNRYNIVDQPQTANSKKEKPLDFFKNLLQTTQIIQPTLINQIDSFLDMPPEDSDSLECLDQQPGDNNYLLVQQSRN
ncbi:16197_t:CDS:2, partial [Dentiscutata erythropus]